VGFAGLAGQKEERKEEESSRLHHLSITPDLHRSITSTRIVTILLEWMNG